MLLCGPAAARVPGIGCGTDAGSGAGKGQKEHGTLPSIKYAHASSHGYRSPVCPSSIPLPVCPRGVHERLHQACRGGRQCLLSILSDARLNCRGRTCWLGARYLAPIAGPPIPRRVLSSLRPLPQMARKKSSDPSAPEDRRASSTPAAGGKKDSSVTSSAAAGSAAGVPPRVALCALRLSGRAEDGASDTTGRSPASPAAAGDSPR